MVGSTLRVLLLAGLAFAIGACGDEDGPAPGVELPPYQALSSANQVDPADFLGSGACADCHQNEYDRWASSTHGRAGGAPPAFRVLAPFDGTPIIFADAVISPRIEGDGRYVFQVEWQDSTIRLEVEGVVGGGHMIGGGTQGFFTRLEDGTLRFLPFDWSHTDSAWFCNARLPTPGRWRKITPSMRLAECADWPPRRALGQMEGASCDSCHGSQIRTHFDVERGLFQTDFTSLAINCESCHGPGRAHVEIVNSGGVLTDATLGLVSLGTLDEDGSLDTCFRCHATRLGLNDGDLPGEPLLENASLLLPQLTDRPHLPDGRIRTFGYQLNHRASACYLDGSMTCTSCHEPHAQTYQDEYKRTLSGPFDDGQCVGCHASKARDPTDHTFHPADSEGSSCVGCHMPYLPQPSLGSEIPYSRSDHVIPIPRPGFDEQFGVTSACAGCHAQVPTETLAAQVRERYGEIKPWRSLVTGIARASSEQDASAAAALLLQPGQSFAMAQASALSQYLVRFVQPDMPSMPPEAQARLEQLLLAHDLDVAALAAATLHLGRGDDPRVQGLLADRVASLGADATLLRDRWAAALRYIGDVSRLRGAPARAIRTYERALEAAPGDPRTLEGLGTAYLADNQPVASEMVLRDALRADPTRAASLVRLARAVAQQDRPDEELSLLQDAVDRFPQNPLVHFELGNALLRRRDMFAARAAFENTLQLDLSLASPRLGLAQILAAQGQPDLAQDQVELALQFEPDNPQAQQLLARLRQP